MESLLKLEVAGITASIFGGDRLGTKGLSMICASGEQKVVSLGLLGFLLMVPLLLALEGEEVSDEVSSFEATMAELGIGEAEARRAPLCNLQLEPPVC